MEEMQAVKQQNVYVKKFCTLKGEDEYFLFLKAQSGCSAFEDSIRKIEQEYFDALRSFNIDEDSAVYRKFFLSDIASQAPLLKRSRLYGEPVTGTKVAISLIQQTPLDSSGLAMFAYHIYSAKGLNKAAPSKQCLLVKRNSVSQLWLTGLSAEAAKGDNNSINEQTKYIFEKLIKEMSHFNASLKDNAMRTWLYIKDIDTNYKGMVDQRREIFSQQGLTSDTHFIASTGIAGVNERPDTFVSMDTLSLLGVNKEQILYLRAPDNLCGAVEYGVTFERGVRISYRDRAHLYISGTSSIDKSGKVVNEGDVVRQAARIIENIEALLHSGNATLKDLMYVVVYIRNRSDAQVIERCLSDKISEIPYVIVEASVCRPEWLVEIEGLAVIKNNNHSLPDF